MVVRLTPSLSVAATLKKGTLVPGRIDQCRAVRHVVHIRVGGLPLDGAPGFVVGNPSAVDAVELKRRIGPGLDLDPGRIVKGRCRFYVNPSAVSDAMKRLIVRVDGDLIARGVRMIVFDEHVTQSRRRDRREDRGLIDHRDGEVVYGAAAVTVKMGSHEVVHLVPVTPVPASASLGVQEMAPKSLSKVRAFPPVLSVTV